MEKHTIFLHCSTIMENKRKKVGWTCDCQHILQSVLKGAEDQDVEKVVDFVESMVLMEVEA